MKVTFSVMSVRLCVQGGPCTEPQSWPPLYRVLSLVPPVQGPNPGLPSLYRAPPPPPRHVQTCLSWTSRYTPPPKPCSNLFSIWGEDCWRVGSWHLTEMPSCYELSLQDEDFINLLSVDLFSLLFEYFIGFETLKMIVYIYKVKINKSA